MRHLLWHKILLTIKWETVSHKPWATEYCRALWTSELEITWCLQLKQSSNQQKVCLSHQQQHFTEAFPPPTCPCTLSFLSSLYMDGPAIAYALLAYAMWILPIYQGNSVLFHWTLHNLCLRSLKPSDQQVSCNTDSLFAERAILYSKCRS